MNKIKLAVIFGGKSSEYQVSLHSAASLLSHIDQDRYELILIGISKDGCWYAYNGDIEHIAQDTWNQSEYVKRCVLSCSQDDHGFLIFDDAGCSLVQVDCMFPLLHGKNGEDGTIQGLFELSGIPYVGCDHMSSSICMDKEMTHIVLDHANIPCAPYVSVYENDDLNYTDIFENAKAKLGLPIFVKPANAGSSFGISKINSVSEFEAALNNAFYHDGKGKVVLEQAIDGFEIGCAVMGNRTIITGSVDEIQTKAPFFDYEGKYEMVDAQIFCPARIDQALFDIARELAKKAYIAMNCKGMTRVDMFVTDKQTIVVNEVNTIPGFTATSRYPSMMKAAGVSFHELINQLVDLALEKQ